jgi:hypothetical protein
MHSADQQLLAYMRTLTAAEIQNRLMRLSDRDIAIALLYFDQGERAYLLSYLGHRKRERVEQELGYIKGMRIRYDQYKPAIERVLETFRKGGGSDRRGYIRPIR